MNSVRGNLFGGLTAAVVALPLALAFGVSSGAGAAAGLYGAIGVGLFASLFGGTKTQISGPTGPMTVVMAAVLTHFIGQSPDHGVALAFTTVMLGGLFQVLFGLMRIGKYIILVPYPVISGFMSGIGVIIILLQVGPFLGQPSASSIWAVITTLPATVAGADTTALILGLVSLAIVLFWPARLRNLFPSPLAALIVGTLLYLFAFPGHDIGRIGLIPRELPNLMLPHLDMAMVGDMITYGLLLAGLGSIDSLLTSLVADNMTGTKHDSNRELIGQGIGNMVAGLFGGLPGAGATMRTATNINAGGTGQLAGVLHAVVLIAIMAGAGPLVEDVPYAVLAGILIKVGIDIIDWRYLRRLVRLPLFSQALMMGVLLLTVFYDLMTAVVLGVFITNIVTIDRLTSLQLDGLGFSNGLPEGTSGRLKLKAEDEELLSAAGGQILLMQLDGPMSFGVAHALTHRLEEFADYRSLIIDLSRASIVGITTALVLEDLIRSEVDQGKAVFLVGVDDKVAKSFAKLDILSLVPEDHQLPKRGLAVRAAKDLLVA